MSRKADVMIEMSALAVAVVSAALAFAREVIALRRYRIRRASIERLVASAGPGARIIDRDADGASVDITVSDVLGDHSRAIRRLDKPAA
jgi:hypothetical protein